MLRLFATLALLLTTSLAHASLGQTLFESNRSFEAWLSDLNEQTVKVNDVEWHVYARHLDQPECTVLLHGFTAEASHWFRFAHKIDKSRCLIIPDLPGFGESSYSANGHYSIPLQAGRVRDLVDTLKPGSKLHIVGSSMGGHIASQFTLDNPDRVLSLTLFDAAGVEAANKSPADHVRESTGKPVFYVTKRASFYHLMDTNFNDPPWMPSLVMDYLADQFIARNERHMHIFNEIHGQNRIDSRLGEIRVPTLIVWGGNDHLLDKSMGERYASLIQGSRYQVFEGVGHLPFLEIPEVSAELFENFLGHESP